MGEVSLSYPGGLCRGAFHRKKDCLVDRTEAKSQGMQLVSRNGQRRHGVPKRDSDSHIQC